MNGISREETASNASPSAHVASATETVSGAPSGPTELPSFEPFMLRGLTYGEVLQQMRATGCAGRRNHWCAPVLIYEGTRLLLDNEDEVHPWRAEGDDRRAVDWETVKPHCRTCGDEKAWREMRWVCTCDYEAHIASLEAQP